MAQTDIPDALGKIDRRDKNVPWYIPDVGEKLGSSAREVLEKYSKIPPEEVEAHVYKIRDQAWQIWPYPCIGGFRFLDLAIAQSAAYSTILQRLKTGTETFLDLGCCFGQEMRRLALDGVPTTSMYGTDLRLDFLQLGYSLFRDSPTFKATLIAADIFAPAPNPLSVIGGKIDIIYAGSFLHLFGYANQVEICKKIVGFLKPKEGSLLVGRQVGNLESGEHVHRTNKEQTMFRHNGESFKKMWEEVGEATGTKWRVETALTADERFSKERGTDHGPGMRLITFSVWRE